MGCLVGLQSVLPLTGERDLPKSCVSAAFLPLQAILEKASIDEVYVDVTPLVEKELMVSDHETQSQRHLSMILSQEAQLIILIHFINIRTCLHILDNTVT